MTDLPDSPALPPPERRIYCNRTLNLRAIRAVGYDLDYTLVHYRVEPWERRAYRELQDKLAAQGLPVADLVFDPELVTRGLVVDTELGNLVKANRFGYVTRAAHGTRLLSFAAISPTGKSVNDRYSSIWPRVRSRSPTWLAASTRTSPGTSTGRPPRACWRTS